jgi:hypothetical protein
MSAAAISSPDRVSPDEAVLDGQSVGCPFFIHSRALVARKFILRSTKRPIAPKKAER